MDRSGPRMNRPPQWCIQRADWQKFQSNLNLTEGEFNDVDEMAAHFNGAVLHAADLSIPKSTGKPRHPFVPWWNASCSSAVSARKKALARLSRYPTMDNLIEYKRCRAKARRTIRESKNASWRAYISSLNSHAPSRLVWRKVRQIKGYSTLNQVPALLKNGVRITSRDEVAEELACHFEIMSSSANYSPAFLSTKERAEIRRLDFFCKAQHDYNIPFSMDEMRTALSLAKGTAPGPDNIHNLMLKHLPDFAMQFLLLLFNRIWEEHTIPALWREAIVVPVAKEGKDRLLPSSYRPISLSSCVCKILERMVNQRLVWSLEAKNLLTPIQCGFRKHRSTLDHLVSLATAISSSFVLRQHLVAILFDIEKAYDTTWRYGILRTLHSWGFRGLLPLFLQDFLWNRSFRVRVGDRLSKSHPLENGIPQGSVLSVTLFAIAINGIASTVREPVKASLFVDDFAIFCSSSSISTIERQLQLVLNKLHEWSLSTGFNFSTTKSTGVHFCRIYHLHNNPVLYLGGNQLPFAESARFLGLTFDRTLTWRHHIRSLQTRCVSRLNLLRMLSGTSWGADRTCLLRLYRSLIRSVLDYGSVVYGSAAPSTLRPLNSIHHAGIRLSTGAFRTSRVECLLAEAGEPSLKSRREILLGSYGIKVAGLLNHPCRRIMVDPKYESSYTLRTSLPQPPGIRFRNLLRNFNVDLPTPAKPPSDLIPPWKLLRSNIDLRLSKLPKGTTCPVVYQMRFQEMRAAYPDHIFLYTDGSSCNEAVSCSFYCTRVTKSFRLHPLCSVFTAELYAVLEALKYTESASLRKVVLCCDSLSCLKAVSSLPKDNLMRSIQNRIHSLLSRHCDLVLSWVPGHVGILGNELADQAAKSATRKNQVDIPFVPSSDVKAFLRRSILEKWQTEWHTTTFKLSSIKDSVKPWHSSSRPCRREETILTRLRIGHCLFSHRFLLRGESAPNCDSCGTVLTVKHVLLHCPKYADSRRRCALGNSLREVLGDDDSALSKLFCFLRESGIYNLI